MTLQHVEKDPEALTLTLVAEFAAPVERVWQLWEDPRQLERWWGPPTHPATFVDHDLRPDGRMAYVMTGPDGDEFHGWWRIIAVDRPRRIEFEDGFSDDDGQPNHDLPAIGMVVEFTEAGGGATTMSMVSSFASTEAMEQVLEMGAEEGMTLALGQIEALLAETSDVAG